MKKLTAYIITIALLLCCCPMAGHADEGETNYSGLAAHFDYKTHQLSVSLAIPNPAVNQVTMTISQPYFATPPTDAWQYGEKNEITDADDIQALHEKLFYMDTAVLLKESAYKKTLTIPDDAPSGIYYIRIGVTGVSESFETTVFYGNGAMRSYAFEQLNSLQGDAAFSILQKYSQDGECPILNIHMVGIDSAQYMPVFDALKQELPFADLLDAEVLHQATDAVMHINANGVTPAILEQYKSFLGLNTNQFYQESICGDIAELMESDRTAAGGLFRSIAEINASFDRALLIAAINHANADSLTEIVHYYRPVLSLEYEDFSPYLVNRRLIDRSYTDLEAFKNAFAAAKNALKSTSTATPKPSYGGGGGGRSGPAQSFVVPSKKTEEQASPRPTATPESATYFRDIGSVPWAKAGIDFLTEKGIQGKAEGLFAPNDMMKREESAKFLVLALNMRTNDTDTVAFEDVDKSSWYYPYVASLAEEHLISGYTPYEFGVGRYVSREDFFVILYRILEKREFDFNSFDLETYRNAENISPYAATAIAALSSIGLIEGNDGFISPRDGITRAQAAKTLHLFSQKIAEGGAQ